jgi:hypothetical protein
MIVERKKALAATGVLSLIATLGVISMRPAGAAETGRDATAKQSSNENVRFQMAFTSEDIARCMPNATVDVTVKLQDDEKGRDVLLVNGSGLRPDTEFTTFLVEKPEDPFGAVEYLGDFEADENGDAHAELRAIVEEAFASTLVNGKRARVDLNHVGMWFADPAGDDFCFGINGGKTTPFDGDGTAGVQAFNTANILPANPLP